MRKINSINDRKCCSTEKQRLVKELRVCDNFAVTPEARHQCIRDAARESGKRARECMINPGW